MRATTSTHSLSCLSSPVRLIAAWAWLTAPAAPAAVFEDVRYPREQRRGMELVRDSLAHEGFALAGIRGQSEPAAILFNFYTRPQPVGLYEVTWRLKTSEPLTPEAICSLTVKQALGRPLLEVKGTDFTAAGQYQEFSLTIEKPEGGYLEPFAVWTGQGDVYLDRCRVRLARAFTDQEWAQRSGQQPYPGVWSFPFASRPRVLIGKGLWWEFFALREAPAWMRAIPASAYHAGPAGSLSGYPQEAESLMGYPLVILADVDAHSLSIRQRLMLKEYVEAGGAALFFGGAVAFGLGGYGDTSLADWLPCRVGAEPDRQPLPSGAVLTPTAAAEEALPGDLAWEQRPLVFYRHELTPREGASVWLTAGGLPILMVREFGKGRVAVWCGTPEGDPAPEQLAFWEWGDLGRCVAAVGDYLVRGQAVTEDRFDPERDGQTLVRLAQSLAQHEDRASLDELQCLLGRCRSKAFAGALLDSVIASGHEDLLDGTNKDIPYPMVSGLAGAIRPFVDADMAATSHSLLESGGAGRRALGLRLAGLLKTPDARAVLLAVARSERPPAAGNDPGEELHQVAAGIDSPLLQRLVAVQALADLGDRSCVEALQSMARELEGCRPRAQEAPYVLEPDRMAREDTYVHALLARLRLSDASAVAPWCEAAGQLASRKEWHRNFLDRDHRGEDPRQVKIAMDRSTAMLTRDTSRLADLASEAALLPDAVRRPMAEELARRSDPLLLPLAYMALTPRAETVQDAETALTLLPLVTGSRLPELRELGYASVALCREDRALQALAQAQAKVAGSGQPGDALFALSRLPRLPLSLRQVVFSAAVGATDDARVQKLARHSAALLPAAAQGSAATLPSNQAP